MGDSKESAMAYHRWKQLSSMGITISQLDQRNIAGHIAGTLGV